MHLNEVNLKHTMQRIDRFIWIGKYDVPAVQWDFFHIRDASILRICYRGVMGTTDKLRLYPHVMQ
jgi:hypothetical protein